MSKRSGAMRKRSGAMSKRENIDVLAFKTLDRMSGQSENEKILKLDIISYR